MLRFRNKKVGRVWLFIVATLLDSFQPSVLFSWTGFLAGRLKTSKFYSVHINLYEGQKLRVFA